MKRNRLKWIFPLVVASITLSGCDFLNKIPGVSGLLELLGIKEEQKPDQFSLKYTDDFIAGDEINLSAADSKIQNYYKTVDIENETGSYLCEALSELMWNTHTVQVKYNQFQSYCSNVSDHDSIELVPGTSLNEVFYSGNQVKGYQGNREHVWPAANSAGLWDHDKLDSTKTQYVGGGSDLYHVRLANSGTNTLRGNSHFIDFEDFPSLSPTEVNLERAGKPLLVYGFEKDGNSYKYASRTEVDDSFKGDVARILAYLWLHYSEWLSTPTQWKDRVGHLQLTSVLGYNSEEKCQRVLCYWNKIDPPSAVEIHRNETVFGIQGNRNPFVDFPGLMNACFDL